MKSETFSSTCKSNWAILKSLSIKLNNVIIQLCPAHPTKRPHLASGLSWSPTCHSQCIFLLVSFCKGEFNVKRWGWRPAMACIYVLMQRQLCEVIQPCRCKMSLADCSQSRLLETSVSSLIIGFISRGANSQLQLRSICMCCQKATAVHWHGNKLSKQGRLCHPELCSVLRCVYIWPQTSLPLPPASSHQGQHTFSRLDWGRDGKTLAFRVLNEVNNAAHNTAKHNIYTGVFTWDEPWICSYPWEKVRIIMKYRLQMLASL